MRKQEPSIQSAPLDAVGFGVKYHPPYLPTVQWGYFSCYVTYVNNPSDFRIQVIGDDTTTAFNKLMDEIEKTYNHRTGKAYRYLFIDSVVLLRLVNSSCLMLLFQ